MNPLRIFFRACPHLAGGVGLCVGSLRSVLRTSPTGCHYYPSRTQKQNNLPIWYILCALWYVLFASGCYTLSGITVPAGVQSFSVTPFVKNTPGGVPTLGQELTEKLVNKIRNNTPLSYNNNSEQSDVSFVGYITEYRVSPIAATANSTNTRSRLSITVSMEYTCKSDAKLSYNRNFTQYEDFDATQNFNTIEPTLVQSIGDQLIQDIVNAAFANW
jgi:hypothetical protein